MTIPAAPALPTNIIERRAFIAAATPAEKVAIYFAFGNEADNAEDAVHYFGLAADAADDTDLPAEWETEIEAALNEWR